MDNVKFNTAIAAMMTLLNEINKVGHINKYEFRQLLLLLNPFAPHMTEELWEIVGYSDKITEASWPTYDESKLTLDEIEVAVQVNSKIVDRIMIDSSLDEEGIKAVVTANEKVQAVLAGKDIKKVIIIKGRLVNIIA